MSKILIGTSGFDYEHWRKVFYPKDLSPKEWLSFYAKHFDTVEINTSFYHQVSGNAYKSWKRTVGENFIFSVKGSRFITHIKKLKDPKSPVKNFFEGVRHLGKDTVALWQLPPNWKFDEIRLEEFVKVLPKEYRHAFEFRNEAWLNDKTFEILKKNNMAIVFQDNDEWPKTEVETADFVYIRLHGRKLYTSSYSDVDLKDWATKILNWSKKGKEVYMYFNNDTLGYAVLNAQRLKEFLASATL